MTLMFVCLLLISKQSNAAEVTWVQIFSHHTINNLPSDNREYTIILPWIRIDTPFNNVFYRTPWGTDDRLSPATGWNTITGGFNYNKYFQFPSQISSLKDQPQTFWIDVNDNGILDNDDMTSIITIPEDYISLETSTNVQVSGGVHPIITWDGIGNADFYRIRFFSLLDNGLVDGGGILFSSEDILPSIENTYSYSYTGDIFENGRKLALAVDAFDFDDTNDAILVNHSRYSIEYQSAPVPLPAPVLLLASGLFGLAGVRRRLIK